MSKKKTDLEKRLAKQIEGRQKSTTVPQRFGKGSVASASNQQEPGGDASRSAAAAAPAPAPAKLVAVSVRLPAAMTQQLRTQAVGREGGISALVAEAVDQWLAKSASQPEKP